jgi:membrane protease YdiL (CAAX protease family)
MTRGIHEKIFVGLERLNTVFYVAIFVVLKILWGYVSDHIYFAVSGGESFSREEKDLGSEYLAFFVVTIAAPLVETYLIQYLFFKYLSQYLNQMAIIVISAIAFGLFHHYNVGYVVYAFFSGLILSTSYAIKIRSNPFVCTSLIHAVYNLFGFLYDRC